jgi:hypothetical protein
MFLPTSREHMLKRIFHAIFVSNMKRGDVLPQANHNYAELMRNIRGKSSSLTD